MGRSARVSGQGVLQVLDALLYFCDRVGSWWDRIVVFDCYDTRVLERLKKLHDWFDGCVSLPPGHAWTCGCFVILYVNAGELIVVEFDEGHWIAAGGCEVAYIEIDPEIL